MAPAKGKAVPKKAAVSGYSTDKELFATRYKQGGRTVYAVAMTPAQIASTVKKPDPAAKNPGNRQIRLKHAQDFARYFIEHDSWVAPGIILRAPNIFSFDASTDVADVQFGVLKYAERNQGDIHILDGQHRILGFHLALENVDYQLDKARDQKATARRQERTADTPADAPAGPLERAADQEIKRLEAVRDRLYTERASVEIQVTDDLTTWRQMFFDIADNALGITASVKARFDSRKVLNRALPLIFEHPLLVGRVDLEQDRLPRKSPYFLTARHVSETVRVVTVGFDGRIGRRAEREMKEQEIAARANEFFTLIGEAFPELTAMRLGQLLPDALRSNSLLGAPLFIRILAGAYWDLTKNHGWTTTMVGEYFTTLAPHLAAPIHANTIWKLHAPEEAFLEGAYGPSGRRQDSKALVGAMVKWALDAPSFLTEAPLPAPEPEEQTDEEILDEIRDAQNKPDQSVRVAVEDMVEEVAKESKARGRARSTVKKK